MEDNINFYNWKMTSITKSELGTAQPQLVLVIVDFFLIPLFKTPEGVVVGFQIFAWAPNKQKY